MSHLLRLTTLCLGLIASGSAFAQIPGGGGCPGAATTSTLGCVKVDGTSITITSGVISAPTGGSGNVVGPASSTNTDLAAFNGTTGLLLQDSGITTANVNTLSGNQTITGNKVFSGTLSGAGLTNYLAAPAAIGGTTPAAGAFTTLSASSTVSGTGFSTYLASPPAIGGSAPAAGAFTTLSATGNLTTNITGGGTVCVQASNTGVLSTSGSACGSGGGAGVSSLATGSPSLVLSGTGSGPYTGDVTATLTLPARSTSSAAIVSTDGTGAVINTSGGMTIANATGGLGNGFGTNILAVAAATLTPTTATINGNATEPLGINQGISLFSLSGEYFAILGMPEPVASSVLVTSSGRVPGWQAGTSSQLVKGDGSLGTLGTAAAVNTGTSGATIPLLNAANTWSALQAFNDGDLAVNGAVSGSLKLHAASAASTSSITFPVGTTDFSATGGTSQFIKQASSGAALTVARPACADLSDSAASCSTLPVIPQAITWVPGINPNNIPIFRANASRTITAIICRPEVAAGGTATVSIVKAASGTALSGGTVLHSGSCNANGTAATDQTLTVTTSSLASGDTVGITTTGTTVWTSSGVATGVVTVYIQ